MTAPNIVLIMAAAGIRHDDIDEPCSLVDMTPTFPDAASTVQAEPELGMPIDGRPLRSLATGAKQDEPDASEIAKRCDSEQIRIEVIATQKQRRAIHAAMEAGLMTGWDDQPGRNAGQEYVRNHMDWTLAGEKSRFPLFKVEVQGGIGS